MEFGLALVAGVIGARTGEDGVAVACGLLGRARAVDECLLIVERGRSGVLSMRIVDA